MVSRISVYLLVLLFAGCVRITEPNAEPNDKPARQAAGSKLWAGAARVEITDLKSLPINDPLFVKALVVKDETKTIVLITLDAVAIGEIGPVSNEYLPSVRGKLEKELKIRPENVLVNSSHCHGIVRSDVDVKTVEAVRKALSNLAPVRAGVGTGREDRISENRRIILKDKSVVDVRHAYSMPPDEAIASIGPIDPEIGILRLDHLDGTPLAVVYNFACHPIMGVPNGGNTADLVGYSSQVIEENLGHGAVALFVQGCGGDINPVLYKEVHLPRNAETLGNQLGLSTLRGIRAIQCKADLPLEQIQEIVELPRADHGERIAGLEAKRDRLMKSLKGTTLDLKTFLQLAAKYNLSKEFPTYYSHHYEHEKLIGREDLSKLDLDNRAHLAAYIQNVLTMEEITRIQTNLALLKKHQERNLAAGRKPLPVEVHGLRIGDYALVTFPGELTVEIGLKIKKRILLKNTFVAGYTNGYIYYTPTADQLRNPGAAQEDSDCMVAPEWESIFHERVDRLLSKLNVSVGNP